jgi:predicted site-specific integrase-resolvase
MHDHLQAVAAADRLGISRRTLMRWIHAGKVHGAHKLPHGHWVVPLEWIDEVTRPAAEAKTHEEDRPPSDRRPARRGGRAPETLPRSRPARG